MTLNSINNRPENASLKIWNRDFILPVQFDVYKGEQILPVQEKALKEFLAHPQILQNPDMVWSYIEKQNPEEITVRDNIFKYVIPKSVLVIRNTVRPEIALLCDYKFDPEHGIALHFLNNRLTEVCDQDKIL